MIMPPGGSAPSFIIRWDAPWPLDQTDFNQGCRCKIVLEEELSCEGEEEARWA
jgi:hypothetical protein